MDFENMQGNQILKMEDADGDGTFRTGKKWPGIWTRDISYATVLSLAWMEDKGYYGQYLHGMCFRSLSPRAEALGEGFTVLFDIADEKSSLKVLRIHL